MSSKTNKRFMFEVDLNWLSKGNGILTSNNATGPVHVGLPPEFGGEDHPWSPEHLLLSAISSCFMNTFLVFIKKFQTEISKFECSAIGQVELVEGKYKFTQVDLYPRIQIANDSFLEKTKLALEKAHQYCLVSNLINAHVIYHSEIRSDQELKQNEDIRA